MTGSLFSDEGQWIEAEIYLIADFVLYSEWEAIDVENGVLVTYLDKLFTTSSITFEPAIRPLYSQLPERSNS